MNLKELGIILPYSWNGCRRDDCWVPRASYPVDLHNEVLCMFSWENDVDIWHRSIYLMKNSCWVFLKKMGLIWKSKLGRRIWWIKGCFDSLKVMLLVFNHHNDSSLMPKFWYFGVGNVGFWVSRERSSQKQAKGWWTSEEGARLYSQNTKKEQQKNPSRVTGWPQPVQPVHQPVQPVRSNRSPKSISRFVQFLHNFA